MPATAPPTRILITGANAGLGKECARQLALLEPTTPTKIILACRNEEKANAAKEDLEASTGKKGVFEVLVLDVSDLDSVRKAVTSDLLKDPIDGLVMNAGGAGGTTPEKLNSDGVTEMVAANVLGHVLLTDLLLEQKKLSDGSTAIYAGSEAARGVPSLGVKKPELNDDGSVAEFASLCDGTFYGDGPKNFDSMYGHTKLMATLWMSSMARRQNSDKVRFVTVSPGATTGTKGGKDLTGFKEVMFGIMGNMMKFFGMAHGLESGAKRYVDVLCDSDGETYKSGVFYASKKGLTGPMVDQACFTDVFTNETYQDNASAGLHKFIK